MTRQHSNSDLAGNLGASLTPRIDRAPMPPRGAQNSGLFDVGAMYAVALDQVMVRAREQARLVPLPRSAQPTWPRRAAQWAPTSIPIEVDVPIEFSRASGAARPVGMGWLGVAVAWLGTVTAAALVSVALPAHASVGPRVHAGTIIYVGPVPRAVAPAAVAVAASPVAEPTATPFVLPTATPFVLPNVAPVAGGPVPALPVVNAPVSAMPVVPSVPAPKRVVRAVSAPRFHAHAAAAVAAPVAPAPAPAIASAAPVSAPMAKPAPAPASGAMSLEDLIRHEVQAESSKRR